ncbi:uncharacterized protein V1510DRAFT_401855 [Dipodascopsis tothii]|uniref:uncharacterized protein n=1 Tax=Dipodascopsis tothii TaxID=44089 RepID=UPI0034CD2755
MYFGQNRGYESVRGDDDSDDERDYSRIRLPASEAGSMMGSRDSSVSSVSIMASASMYPVIDLDWSVSPQKTYRKVMKHKWTWYDLQYIFLLAVAVFCLAIMDEPGPFLRVLYAALLAVALVVPITSQFFFPVLPILAWACLFYSCRFIPTSWRPSVWVSVLSNLERILYGENLSNILSAYNHPILDVLAWLPYGIIHFVAPVLCSIAIFFYASPGTLSVWARSFGYMNLIGVILELSFPTTPPWYEDKYGMIQATYGMAGSPGGLARIDELFGHDIYTSTFNASPLVFGAFPSLHSGCAVLEALFLSHVFPRLTPAFCTYVFWIWWSTMYLTHHYFIDLMGGASLSITVYLLAKWKFLPVRQPRKRNRFSYRYVQKPSYHESDDDLYTDEESDDDTLTPLLSPEMGETN